VRAYFRKASPELYLAGLIVVSLGLAAIVAQFPGLAFGSFVRMAGVLIGADLVLYVLMKLEVVKAPRDRKT
jgi:hypothetical protein